MTAPDPTLPTRLAEAIPRLARASVLVVGDAMLDRYVHGTVERISLEAPIPILRVEREVALPGGAGNVVRNLTAYGVAVAFVAIVGDDQAGSDLTGLIGGQPNVEPWLLVQGGRTTTRKTRFLSKGQQMMRTDREETDPIHPKLADRLLRIARDALAATTVTLLSDYGKGVLAGDMAGQIIAAARAAGRRVVVDPCGLDYGRYAGADVITPSARELCALTGQAAVDDAAITEAAARLRDQHGFGAVLVTRAAQGMTLVQEDGTHHMPACAPELVDVAGAGDMVVATLAAGLAAGLAVENAAALANRAAGLSVGKPGIAVVRPEELLETLDTAIAITR